MAEQVTGDAHKRCVRRGIRMTILRFRLFVVALVPLLVFGNPAFAGSKSLKVAMVLWRGATEAEKGFQDGLKELGYSVQYTTMDARQDRTELGRLLREEVQPKIQDFDYIYTFGTTVSKAAKTAVADQVPQLFNIVADPVEGGIVQSMESSGGNIGGASNTIPIPLQMETALKIFPLKRLGLLFNPREKNSMAVRKELSEIAKRYQIEVVDLPSAPVLDVLQSNLQKLRNKSVRVDAVYLPQDSFLVSQAKHIGSELRTAKVKSIAAIKDYVDHGALMGVVSEYYALGKAVARIVDRHQKGEKLQSVAVQIQKDPTLVINTTTSELLGVKVQESLLKRAVIVK